MKQINEKTIELVNQKIDQDKENILADLAKLINIKSESGQPEPGKPFGKGVDDALALMFDMAQKEELEYENIDGYGGHIDFGGYEKDEEGNIVGSSGETMGILCHLDTVPAGDGWTKEPLGGIIEDGKFYGRGAIDNKGPTIAVFHAIKALKDCGAIPEKRVRLILGLDEETNWEGMDYYLSKVAPPDFGFTPDGEFPVINGEKGILVFEIARKFSKTSNKGLELRSIRGGNAANMVADRARAIVNCKKPEVYQEIKEKAAYYRDEKKMKVAVKAMGKSLEIVTQGVSAHGARPGLGENAISVLMEFLGEMTFTNDDVNEFIGFYNTHINTETDGKGLGCNLSDQQSGGTVVNIGMVELDGKAIRLTVNVRYPVSKKGDQIYSAMEETLNKYQLGVVKIKDQEPIYMEPSSELITTLMDIYKKYTGNDQDKPLVIGGGTYARVAENIVAFGPSLPGQRDCAHQKDEFIEVDQLIQITKIYAETIYRLTI